MAGYVNKAIIIGNLGQDPDIKQFDDGGKIANLSVATTEKWKDKGEPSGEYRENTEWHRVTVRQTGSSKIIDGFIEPYVKKGNKVYVEGKLKTRKWTDKNGNDRYTTEIIVAGPNSALELLERPPSNNVEKTPASEPKGNLNDPIDDFPGDWG